ncbi:putative inactive ribonuclease-like protein 12 [Galemys pyrenaicus]|uniref:Ribosomal protein L15 n=1 Tax=Galemys pyrenaicus TaxID=202257 RepID=A0A8J6DIL5_GALPY|nr:putative inactive ribonuclease-like protein 12 [Galemys pyrenaicus]
MTCTRPRLAAAGRGAAPGREKPCSPRRGGTLSASVPGGDWRPPCPHHLWLIRKRKRGAKLSRLIPEILSLKKLCSIPSGGSHQVSQNGSLPVHPGAAEEEAAGSQALSCRGALLAVCQLSALHSAPRATPPDKACRLGYKAKQGYARYRISVHCGGRQRPGPKGVEAKSVKDILPLMIFMVMIFLLLLFWENELNEDVVMSTLEHLHVDYPKRVLGRYCNAMILQRIIREPNNSCKKEHVFIHERPRNINSVCNSPKEVACQNLSTILCFQSEIKFKMTVCQLIEAERLQLLHYSFGFNSRSDQNRVYTHARHKFWYPELNQDSARSLAYEGYEMQAPAHIAQGNITLSRSLQPSSGNIHSLKQTRRRLNEVRQRSRVRAQLRGSSACGLLGPYDLAGSLLQEHRQSQEMMSILITTKLLPLLLLLPQTLKIQRANGSLVTETYEEEYDEYLEDVFSRMTPRPFTKAAFERTVLIDGVRPLYDSYYCTDEIMYKVVQYRFQCVKEHFFLKESIQNIQKLCRNLYVPCKNGVKRCHRSRGPVEGVYCKLIRGTEIPECEYESFYRRGYALITCRWENEIGQIVPEHVNDIMDLFG